MHIHILGISGTFMSGLAVLARENGDQVSGSDMNIYPPMSTQLSQQGISVTEKYDPTSLPDHIDCVIVGNVIKRGNLVLEYILNQRIPYCSGPEWLARHILRNRHVLAVAGTHGKTTTSSLLTWILECAGLSPGFLIGGIPENFGISARLGKAPYFVIEADEYDTAFTDKRSKFIHYQPQTLILNNLEFDHADIFPNLEAIKMQFHHLVRTIPGHGSIIRYVEDNHLAEVLQMGCWTPIVTFGGEDGEWHAKLQRNDGSAFTVYRGQQKIGEVQWSLLGIHNVNNALAALAAATQINISPENAIKSLSSFKSVKRRLEIKGEVNGIVIYDDFAHHPTAIATTLMGLRHKVGQKARVIAVIEFGSYTMRMGVHKDKIQQALSAADIVVCKNTEVEWGLKNFLKNFKQPTVLYDDTDQLIEGLVPQLRSGDHVVVMSNSSFNGIHQRLLDKIK